MHHSTQHAGPSPTHSQSSATAPSELSEDVTSLLRWGRHVLQQEREQRRRTSHSTLSSHMPTSRRSSLGETADHSFYTHAGSARRPNTQGSAAASVSPHYPQPFEKVQVPLQKNASLSSSAASIVPPPLYTQQAVDELRARVAQLEAVNAANTAAFEQRWRLWQLGKARLDRMQNAAAVARREAQIAALITTAQAMVEGEDVVRDTLQELVDRLDQWQHRQDAEREETEAPWTQEQREGNVLADTTRSSISTVPQEDKDSQLRLHAGGEDASADLSMLARALQQRVRLFVQTLAKREEARLTEVKRKEAVRRQRAEVLDKQERQLRQLQSEAQQLARREEEQQAEKEELERQLAAQARAAAVRQAAVARRKALHVSLRHLAELHEDAVAANAVARHELAASEARYAETHAAYDMAVRESEAVEDALRAARRQHREAQQRLDGATARLAELRDAFAAVDGRCASLRARRVACEEDLYTLQEVMRERQQKQKQQQLRLRDFQRPSEQRARSLNPAVIAGDDAEGRRVGGWCSGDDSAENRLAELHGEVEDLQQRVETAEAERAALLQEHKELEEAMAEEKMQIASLLERKNALEADLVSEKPSLMR